jgi:hypothetical protein
MAQSDLNSFCFEGSVNLKSVQNSISFLLLPRDTVNLREEDHCIDIVTSPDRGKLFEKFLSGRYNLVHSKPEAMDATTDQCELVLQTTVTKKIDGSTVKVGEKNVLNKSEKTEKSVSTMEMTLGQGISGELEAGPEKFKVVCRYINPAKVNLQFSYNDKAKGGMTSEFTLSKGEWLNVGNVAKDLNEKNKTLGIPQTEISNTTGQSETEYNLKIK